MTQAPGSAPEISIVIPAYKGARTIATTLTSVRRAADGLRCEIIVVESSGDATAAIVREQFPDVRLICSPDRLSAGAARNRGRSEARGRLVFFTDQDCIVPPHWIRRMTQHFADPTVGAVGGSVGIANLSNLSGCAVYFLEFLYHFPTADQTRRDKNFLVGCNSAYRAEALQAVGFPDQTLGEDVLFSHDLRLRGFGVIYDAGLAVLHHNREGWAEFFDYNRKMGRASAAYHQVLQRWWIAPFLKAPLLAFLSPLVILPSIAVDLLRSRWSYFFRFLLLLPMCLAGNLVWAGAFRRQVLEAGRDATPPETGA